MSWAQIYTSKHTIKFCRNRNIKIAKSKLLNNYNNLMENHGLLKVHFLTDQLTWS